MRCEVCRTFCATYDIISNMSHMQELAQPAEQSRVPLEQIRTRVNRLNRGLRSSERYTVRQSHQRCCCHPRVYNGAHTDIVSQQSHQESRRRHTGVPFRTRRSQGQKPTAAMIYNTRYVKPAQRSVHTRSARFYETGSPQGTILT